MSAQQPPSYDEADSNKPGAMIQVVLTIPGTTVSQVSSATSDKKFVGKGELKVYSTSSVPSQGPSSAATAATDGKGHHHTTFMTLETNDTPTGSYKSLITHPLMPSSTAQKTGDHTWRFSVPGNGYLEVQVPENSPTADIAALENLLTDRIVYTNQYQLRHQLALVDDVGQIYGLLDKEDVEVEDDDTVSLSENAKSPVVVEAIESPDDSSDKPLRLKISVPSADDMADYLTSASQYFGESLIKGATVVAGGITTSSTYLNSKIPETQKPLKISPFIKNRIRNLTTVSRATFSVTKKVKSALVGGALNSGYRVIKYWTAKDDPESYSTMQNMAYSILNSAGVLIQAAEESLGIVSAPAISATQEFAGRAWGPDAKELVTEALEGLKNFTLVYFDGAGVSRRAFLHTSRIAALQTAQEVREGKIKMRERKKNPEKHIHIPASAQAAAASAQAAAATAGAAATAAAASAGAAATHAKELIFSYFGRGEEAHGSSSSAPASDTKKID
ncbi:MAG: senescence-associated protein-domain-containing protein [Linnemannia gamsii]|nr:MAG: senescence-associated protein-domain-containing protein [Linnemannia gamsii]